MKPQVISRRQNIPRGENNQNKTGVAKAKRGYRRGYKLGFLFRKPNNHAGFRLSLEWFHTTIFIKKGLINIRPFSFELTVFYSMSMT